MQTQPDGERHVHAPDASSGSRNGDHLANERTFLAWIRTSISVIGLGFVVAKFSVWLRQIAVQMNAPVPASHTSLSLPLGVGMMAIGGLLAVLASWRYRRVRWAIQHGESAADEGTITVVTALVLCVTAALVVYMLATR